MRTKCGFVFVRSFPQSAVVEHNAETHRYIKGRPRHSEKIYISGLSTEQVKLLGVALTLVL